MQAFLDLIYPPRCLSCEELTASNGMLCGTCRGETPFVVGLVCDLCGVPLPGPDDGSPVHCDDCLKIARPWQAGRAALVYHQRARRLVMALKHGDRQDLARPAARWMLAAAGPLVRAGMAVVPVPIHWTRLVRRRFNQAALLGNEMAKQAKLEPLPTALRRVRRTPVQDGMNVDERFANLAGSIEATPQAGVGGRDILLVDDVMTSGATLAAATVALHGAGARRVDVVVLARVAKDL